MAARTGARRDLFLQVSGSVDPLKAVLKSGSSALVEFKGDAEKQLAAVEKSLQDLGGGDPAAKAKQLTQGYSAAFREIRRNAEQVAGAGSGADAVLIVNAQAAREAATAAEMRAAAIRVVAEAARAEAVAQGGTNAQLVQYAAGAMAAEKEATDYAIALREQANTLTAVEGRMGALVPAGQNITKMSGQARAGMQQLSFQLNDIATGLAGGMPPMMIFAQQVGQVTQAIGLMAGEAKGLIGFIGGPWGMGLTAALVVLTPLVAKLLEGRDALGQEVEKLKENAQASALADEAKKAFAKTEAGIIDDVRKLTDELDRQNVSLKTNAERLNNRAINDLAALRSSRAPAAEKLSAAQTALDEAKRGGPGVGLATLRYAQGQFDKAKAALDAIDKGIADAEVALAKSRAALAVEQANAAAKARATPQGKIDSDYSVEKAKLELEYSQKIVAAKEDLNRQQTLSNELARKLLELETKKNRAVADEQKRQSAARASGNGTVTPAMIGEMLKQQFGGTITSTNTGKHAKNSFHYRDQAVDFVPRGGMGAVSKQQIRSYLESQGIDLKELLGPGDKDHDNHFHVAFSKTQRGQDAVDRDQQTAAERAEREREAEASRQQAYANQLKGAQDELYRAQLALAGNAEERLDVEIEQLQAAKVQRDIAIDAQVAAKKLTAAEAEKLKSLNADTLSLQEIAAYRKDEARQARTREELLDRQLEWTRRDLDRRGTLLQLQGEMATTNKERGRIARELLDIEFAERRARAARKLSSSDLQTRLEGAAETIQINEEEPYRRKQVEQDNAGPLERYKNELHRATDDMHSALEGVEAHALQTVEDSLLGLVDGTETVAGAFKKMASSIIADLARIAIEKALVGALGGGSLFGFLGLKGGGKIEGLASGGRISGPGTGTSDSILALVDGVKPLMVSNGEAVMNARATSRWWPILDAMNKGTLPGLATGGLVSPNLSMPRMADFGSITPGSIARPAPAQMQLDARFKVDASPLLEAHVENVSYRTVSAAADPIMAGAETRTLRRMGRSDLPGGWG